MPIVARSRLLSGKIAIDAVLERCGPRRDPIALEIDRDPFLLPIAVAGWVQPIFFARRRGRIDCLWIGHRRRWAEMRRGLHMGGTFHSAPICA